ncbi:hypothetical protein HN873_056090 [Arachis hypogaea]
MLPSPRCAVPPSLPHRAAPSSLAPGFAASRLLPWLPFQTEPRTRLDTGTQGVGLGYCILATVACPDRLVVAVKRDSGF